MNLIKSELRKLLYSKSFYGYIAGAIFIALITSIPGAFSVNSIKNQLSGTSLMDPQLVAGLYGKAIAGYLFALILGISIIGNEYQNGQAVSTFLATPKRIKVVYAKLAVAVGAGIILMVISTVIGFLGAYIGLSRYPHAKTEPSVLLNILFTAIVSGAVIAVMGIAIGALIRNVKIAQTGAIIWLSVVEKAIVVFWVAGGKFLPSGLIVGMMNIHLTIKSSRKFLNLNTGDYLSPGISVLLLLVYAGIFVAIGSSLSLRRDIK